LNQHDSNVFKDVAHFPQGRQIMTVSNRPISSKNCICVSSEHSSVNEVPLALENLAVLGHEIRNPLSALSYALQAWPSSKDDPQITEQLLQIMRRQVSQLTRLCNDLLDVGKSARGNLTICRTSVDVRQVIQNACEEIQPFVVQRSHKLTVALGDSPLTLLGDESRLTQVFANLLHNSAKFTNRGGHLHISLDRDQDSAIVRLNDNGRGICAERLQNIFITDNGSKKCSDAVGEGLGIGLRLAKSIVELHGGTIEALSEGLELGSTFVVRLPLVGCYSPSTRGTSNSSYIRNKGLAYEVDDATVALSVDGRDTQPHSGNQTKYSLLSTGDALQS
jgi:K+-sensing histidine kinase KdpD